MLTSPDTTSTEVTRPGLRARVRRMSRSAWLAVLLTLAAGATLVTTALPAGADTHAINLARTQSVGGSGCQVTVGTDNNTPHAWPGTGVAVSCSSRQFPLAFYSQLQYGPTINGPWTVWNTSPWYSAPNVYGTPGLAPVYYDWYSCPAGKPYWRVMAYVYLGGVYQGVYANNKPAQWQACT
jgi:hypothetical protein